MKVKSPEPKAAPKHRKGNVNNLPAMAIPGLDTAEPPLLEDLPLFSMAEPSSYSRYKVEDSDFVTRMPETHLLAALLERAVRDLSPTADQVDRRSAIYWFLRKESSDNRGFSFQDVAELLQLSDKHLRFIQEKLEDAKNIIILIDDMDD